MHAALITIDWGPVAGVAALAAAAASVFSLAFIIWDRFKARPNAKIDKANIAVNPSSWAIGPGGVGYYTALNLDFTLSSRRDELQDIHLVVGNDRVRSSSWSPWGPPWKLGAARPYSGQWGFRYMAEPGRTIEGEIVFELLRAVEIPTKFRITYPELS